MRRTRASNASAAHSASSAAPPANADANRRRWPAARGDGGTVRFVARRRARSASPGAGSRGVRERLRRIAQLHDERSFPYPKSISRTRSGAGLSGPAPNAIPPTNERLAGHGKLTVQRDGGHAQRQRVLFQQSRGRQRRANDEHRASGRARRILDDARARPEARPLGVAVRQHQQVAAVELRRIDLTGAGRLIEGFQGGIQPEYAAGAIHMGDERGGDVLGVQHRPGQQQPMRSSSSRRMSCATELR